MIVPGIWKQKNTKKTMEPPQKTGTCCCVCSFFPLSTHLHPAQAVSVPTPFRKTSAVVTQATRQRCTFFFFFLFFIPFIILALLSRSLPVATQIRGHSAGSSRPSRHRNVPSSCPYREKNSSFPSLDIANEIQQGDLAMQWTAMNTPGCVWHVVRAFTHNMNRWYV